MQIKQAVPEAATICPDPCPCKLTFDLLTLKVVSESRVTWATSVPILVFLGLYVLDLGQRSTCRGRGHIVPASRTACYAPASERRGH